VGVSRDSVTSHQKFKQKYGIPFTLLADVDGTVCNAFGVNSRSTFLVGADKMIRKVWPKVRLDGHAREVLESLP
jgi:peroxiredoxin Q/BCP